MTIKEANRQIQRWRQDAKEIHGYTDAELAKVLGCEPGVLTHKSKFYAMRALWVLKLKELAEDG